jgi:hypothetical protein
MLLVLSSLVRSIVTYRLAAAVLLICALLVRRSAVSKLPGSLPWLGALLSLGSLSPHGALPVFRLATLARCSALHVTENPLAQGVSAPATAVQYWTAPRPNVWGQSICEIAPVRSVGHAPASLTGDARGDNVTVGAWRARAAPVFAAEPGSNQSTVDV